MRVTRATDYAFAVLVHLAQQDSTDVISVKELSRACNVPQRFLANIVNGLAHSGLLESRRGKQGGVRIARPTDEITMRDVIEAVEGPIRLVDCQGAGGSDCIRSIDCAMRSTWGAVSDELLQLLDARTLADLVDEGESIPVRA